jgi:hypothetical protein
MISNLVSKRTVREFETSIDSLIKLSQTGCSQTLLILYAQCNCKWLYWFGAIFCKILAFLIRQTVVNNWAKMVMGRVGKWAKLTSFQ